MKLNGWAIESRLYAEDPYRNFLPSIGRLVRYRPPQEGETETGTIIRNDTGVYEGGEISMFYDPMIAKLCTWGKDRKTAITAMANALDSFEVDGIGHNLPFLSAVMDHERFKSGNITTAFIAEEYPDGFTGVALPKAAVADLAAIACACNFIHHQRATRITGAMENHRRVVGRNWVIQSNGHNFLMHIDRDGQNFLITRSGEHPELLALNGWTPGDTLINAEIGGRSLQVKVERKTQGYRLRYRGADLRFHTRSPREAHLAGFMLEKVPADTSKFLLCPMPGLVVAINVAEGDSVEEGQALASVEAMKMENILRAERKGIIGKINAKPGDSLAVDEVILEFA